MMNLIHYQPHNKNQMPPSYGGKEIHFFGLVWPQLVTPNPEMKKVVEGIHEFLGNSLYFLIGIHVLAGLWQHYFIKDDTLRRMLNKVSA